MRQSFAAGIERAVIQDQELIGVLVDVAVIEKAPICRTDSKLYLKRLFRPNRVALQVRVTARETHAGGAQRVTPEVSLA